MKREILSALRWSGFWTWEKGADSLENLEIRIFWEKKLTKPLR
jgi:hypothetical protein